MKTTCEHCGCKEAEFTGPTHCSYRCPECNEVHSMFDFIDVSYNYSEKPSY